ncbi:hypothetical protein J2Z40_002213 [Cytobacillus eiseniae]|uniref:DUF308 domain-containing protein n=1 Tax=Cytobacillus eiseniae TaxID=762947 RepID=A0ABS4RFG8_9BACI|nr:DUF4190 domain-containing protein [Cytobacillus eiseniae]MBP2241641.1 hypothetical protein [Cytobacillus eiseniae]
MADHDREYEDYDLRHSEQIGEKNQYGAADYSEETSAELAAPISFDRSMNREERNQEAASAGKGIGFAALILSIVSLFVLPVLFGAVGIVLGFVAMRRGSTSLGSWAIGIGAASIVIGMFILPFF